MSEFMKNDSEKVRLELIDPFFIEGVGKVLTFGAKKYKAHNWKKASSHEDIQRIIGSAKRHLLEFEKGNMTDDESGLTHIEHAATNLMFLHYHTRDN